MKRKMKKWPKPQRLEVKWKDSWSNDIGKWTAEEIKAETDFVLFSNGYLVHQDKKGITLGSEYRVEDKTFRHVHHIPRDMVIKVRRLNGKGR